MRKLPEFFARWAMIAGVMLLGLGFISGIIWLGSSLRPWASIPIACLLLAGICAAGETWRPNEKKGA